MSNAVAKPDAAPKPPIEAGGKVAGIVPQDIDQVQRLAYALANAGDMVPRHFQGNQNAIIAAILRGADIGLAPMQALSSISVINGRATIWGDAIPALMQRAGHHVDVEIEGAGDKAVATATLTRGDTGRKIVRRFSMADAKLAGLAGKQGPWQQYPLRMLAHRARTYAVRDGAADALMGLALVEEVMDYGPDHARDVTPASPPRGGAVYREPEPLAEVDEVIEVEPAEAEDNALTPDQRAEKEAAYAELDARREELA